MQNLGPRPTKPIHPGPKRAEHPGNLVVPKKHLESLGITPLGEKEFQLANGERVKRKFGVAVFEYQNNVGGAPVIFGEKIDHTLLGITALESMGLSINPMTRELISIPAYFSKYA